MKQEDLEFFENLVGGKENIDAGFGREYNIFAMEQGIAICESLQTKENIIDFSNPLTTQILTVKAKQLLRNYNINQLI